MRDLTAAGRLEGLLEGFVDAAMTGDDERARQLFGDAQAFGVEQVRGPAVAWVAEELPVAAVLPDAPRGDSDRSLEEGLARARRVVGS